MRSRNKRVIRSNMANYKNSGEFGVSSVCYMNRCKDCKYTRCQCTCHPDGTRGWK